MRCRGNRRRRIHAPRRTAEGNLERAGVSRSVAMKLTGHKMEAFYRRYAINSAADLTKGVAKVAILHSAPIGPRSVRPSPGGDRGPRPKRLRAGRSIDIS